MDARLQRRVQRYGWDRAARDYEIYWREQVAPAQERLLAMAALAPGQRVLDLACGTGLVTFPAARAVAPTGAVVGTDISGKMVDQVRADAERKGLENVTFERSGAEELDYPDETFDAVLCSLGLMYVPDPLTALREMNRVLVSGGRAVSAVWGARTNCGWAEIFPIVDSRVKTEVCPLFFQLGTGETLARGYETAGLVDVTTDRIEVALHYPSTEDALGAAFVGGPVALAYSRFDDSTREEAHRDYLASIESFKSGSGYEIPGEFVVTEGRRP